MGESGPPGQGVRILPDPHARLRYGRSYANQSHAGVIAKPSRVLDVCTRLADTRSKRMQKIQHKPKLAASATMNTVGSFSEAVAPLKAGFEPLVTGCAARWHAQSAPRSPNPRHPLVLGSRHIKKPWTRRFVFFPFEPVLTSAVTKRAAQRQTWSTPRSTAP